jgi:hypothetical protein
MDTPDTPSHTPLDSVRWGQTTLAKRQVFHEVSMDFLKYRRAGGLCLTYYPLDTPCHMPPFATIHSAPTKVHF